MYSIHINQTAYGEGLQAVDVFIHSESVLTHHLSVDDCEKGRFAHAAFFLMDVLLGIESDYDPETQIKSFVLSWKKYIA